MRELLIIAIGSALVNNVVLSQFLGICPFLGVSKKVETAAGMGGAVIFVITIASFVTSLIYKFILANEAIMGGKLVYLQTIVFILVIACLVQFVEMFLKKAIPSLYQALGVYLPLITTNCAVLGVALTNVQKEYSVLQGVINGIGTSAGFALAIVIMAGIREKIEYNDVSESFQGTPIVLITASLMAIAFFGFSGLI
ncbi:electron transport complex protein RnfA [[Clostridium] hylemonae]|uniref:Ion-translocating oxidoreductase complex subunit A n=1 Tax=[Clostridium] hylemonae DSM 15053 TaxID=553973 RepID=C0BWH6_9FIRM|nr:RnfABCDGE type electron transport complex subunit A [[Clostridium] hylemonae]EEG75658.1 electron transport complex, RnfABCDGE type, A subunit [[Clostridium] hylemonae DSM 15053]QEK17790.1 Electron transport complex subunit RsxA [[Clostridium] hylemonae DSM 15053]BDF04807.1 electron transport complex subunit A [[Clostridium] hylemonae]